MPVARPIVVLSDTHFGEEDATLGVSPLGTLRDEGNRRRVDALVESLGKQGPFQEIVLLGDIFELWLSPATRALTEASYFFQRISALDVERIVYVVGNHDHHLLIRHIEQEEAQAIAARKGLSSPYRPQLDFHRSFLRGLFPEEARPAFLVRYPDHTIRLGDKRLIFHHGHHLACLQEGLDFFSFAPLFIVEKLEERPLERLSRKDLERGSTIFFEAMHAIALGERTPAKINRLWDWLQLIRGGWEGLCHFLRIRLGKGGTRNRRGTEAMDIHRFDKAVERLLHMRAQELGEEVRYDAFVFGHTHRAGLFSGGQIRLANAGCWLREVSKPNEENINTLLLVDRESLSLYQLTEEGLSLKGQMAW